MGQKSKKDAPVPVSDAEFAVLMEAEARIRALEVENRGLREELEAVKKEARQFEVDFAYQKGMTNGLERVLTSRMSENFEYQRGYVAGMREKK